MTYKFVIETKEEIYLEHKIYAIKYDNNTFMWYLYKGIEFILGDFNTIDGDKLTSINQSINDAKKNLNTLIRLKLI